MASYEFEQESMKRFIVRLTFTSKPNAYAFTKSAPFWSDPISFVYLDVFGVNRLFIRPVLMEHTHPNFYTSPVYIHANLQAKHLS